LWLVLFWLPSDAARAIPGFVSANRLRSLRPRKPPSMQDASRGEEEEVISEHGSQKCSQEKRIRQSPSTQRQWDARGSEVTARGSKGTVIQIVMLVNSAGVEDGSFVIPPEAYPAQQCW
jgi:hypothetical protein